MSSQSRKQLQGPRPAPLTVGGTSSKTKKPVIVYLQSPEVIHVRPDEFMGTVQRLTGNQAPSVAASSHSYTSTTSVMVADENMGMGFSSENQQKFYSGMEYGGDSAVGMPPVNSNFAPPPGFYINRDQR